MKERQYINRKARTGKPVLSGKHKTSPVFTKDNTALLGASRYRNLASTKALQYQETPLRSPGFKNSNALAQGLGPPVSLKVVG